MPRPRDSLFMPIAFAIIAAVFAVGAGYTLWLDYRARLPRPLTEVRAATLPPLPTVERTLPSVPPPARKATHTRAQSVTRCLGADGVPIYTSNACPEGSTLDRRIAVEVPEPPSGLAPPPAATANASALAVVNNYDDGASYYAPSPQERRLHDLDRAQRQCDLAKVRERAELLALGLRKKMRDIRRWADYVVRECATYKVLNRGR